MSQRPENSEPIRSADRIEDPDQPVEMHGKDREHTKDRGHRRHWRRERGEAADEPDTVAHGAAGEEILEGTPRHGAGGRDHPRKALKETGFPNVDAAEVEAIHNREVDTGSLAAVRKFQPPEGRPNPNMTRVPDAGRDYAPGEAHDIEDTETYGTPEKTPPPEPVRHSRVVEDRIQQQERDYDLGRTEEGERYVYPHEE